MKEIEEGLYAVHAEAKARKSETEESMEVNCISTNTLRAHHTQCK